MHQINNNGGLLLSIKPRFTALIFEGKKKVELRKRKPRVAPGDFVFVYASAPTCALVGGFQVGNIVVAAPDALWEKVGAVTGLELAQFYKYYEGAAIGFGICIKRVWKLEKPISLALLKRRYDGFHPPQNYQYLSPNAVGLLLGG